jgi:uncharacterized membrane protein YgcG
MEVVATPPAGLSPASLRYVMRMQSDSVAFAAALADTAERGHLTIARRAKGVYELTRTGLDDGGLPPDERAVAAVLFAKGDCVRADTNHSQIFAKAARALDGALRAEHGDRYFRLNRQWAVPGVLLSAALGAALVFAFTPLARWIPGLMVALFATLWPAAMGVGLRGLGEYWGGVARAGYPVGRTVGAVFGTILGMGIILGIGFGVTAVLWTLTTLGAVLLMLASGTVDYLLFRLLPQPTALGRTVLDGIAGYRAYLAGGGAARHLPYAMALEIAGANGTAPAGLTADAAAAAAAATTPASYPHWYSDDRSPGGAPFDGAGFAQSFSSAVSSSSSSGSSGGSSGGGGGGGGGGGW